MNDLDKHMQNLINSLTEIMNIKKELYQKTKDPKDWRQFKDTQRQIKFYKLGGTPNDWA